MSLGGNLFLRFVLLQYLTVVVLSLCHCPVEHPQQIYCENEFVVKVLLDDFSHEDFGFTAHVHQIFKGEPKKLNINNGSIVVSMHYLCGIEMIEIGKMYIIFGNSKNGDLYTTVCPSTRGNQPFSDTSTVYQKGIAGAYGPGCICSKERFLEIVHGGCIPRYAYYDNTCTLVKTKEFWSCIRYKYPSYADSEEANNLT